MDWKMRATEFISEVKIDNQHGAGAVPYNAEVDYFGIRVLMRPSTFLSLALPLDDGDGDKLKGFIQGGGAIGAPFFEIKVPEEWADGDYSTPATIRSHEGRHRLTAILELEGDAPIETHLFLSGYRARNITPEMVKELNAGMFKEKSTTYMRGPLFKVI